MPHALQPAATLLCLLRAGCEGGLTWTTFVKDAGPALEHQMSRGDMRAAHEAAVEALRMQGSVALKPRARVALVLTAAGRRQAASLLKMGAWPEAASWSSDVAPRLILLALDRLAEAYMSAVRTADGLRRLILEALLGVRVGAKRVGKSARLQAAAAIGSIRDKAKSISTRLLQRAAESFAKDAGRFSTPSVTPRPPQLEAFAAAVKELARETPTGRIGDSLVFINHVWRHACERHPEWGLNLAQFKVMLLSAGIKGLMNLTTANIMEKRLLPDLRESRIDENGRRWDLVELVA